MPDNVHFSLSSLSQKQSLENVGHRHIDASGINIQNSDGEERNNEYGKNKHVSASSPKNLIVKA